MALRTTCDRQPAPPIGVRLSQRLAERVYAESDKPKSRGSKFGKIIARAGVQNTSEFKRILALPRRKWEEGAEEIAHALTESLRLPGCAGGKDIGGLCSVCRCPLRLRPAQGAAVRDAHDGKGLLAPIPVGGGKALISLLIPAVVECERPLLLVPSAVRDQTLRKVLPMVRLHWKLHPQLKIVGHSEMSTVKNADMLETLKPDLIVVDEVHNYKNLKAGRTRRLQRWMREHPETIVCAMSGTITRKSLRDYWHVLLWALKEDMAPLPVRWRELQDWADALDVLPDEAARIAPGALALFATEIVTETDGGTRPETPREGFARRLAETPGVVAVCDADVSCSLVISARSLKPDATMAGHMAKLTRDWELPNGDIVTEAVDLWRHARELALGFFYVQWNHDKFLECLTRALRASDDIETITEQKIWNSCASEAGSITRKHAKDSENGRELSVYDTWKSSVKEDVRSNRSNTEKTPNGLGAIRENAALKMLKARAQSKTPTERNTQIEFACKLTQAEKNILCAIVHTTEKDTALVSVVESKGRANSKLVSGNSKLDTASLLRNSTRYSRSTRDVVISAENSVEVDPRVKVAVQTVLQWTTTTKPAKCVDSFARLAIERSEIWETIFQAYPGLLPIFAEAIEAARPPPEWMDARRAWKKLVRDTISRTRRGLDTELQVWRECAARPDPPAEFVAWRMVKDTFESNTVPEWGSLAAIHDATAWLEAGPGICWVEHRAFGEKLAEVSGHKYYGAGDDSIVDANPADAIIASIRAHGTGKNLQMFARNLITSCPPSGATFEQCLGRTHRSGQEADEVTCEVYLGFDALREALVQSVADARYIQETTGNRQKLLYADCTIEGIR